MFRVAPIVIVALMTIACGGSDSEIARAQAEAEVARLRIEAARAEQEAAQAKTQRLEAEVQAEADRAQREAEAEAARDQEIAETKGRVAEYALRFVRRNSQEILSQAYPMAMQQLRYDSAELMGSSGSSSGFQARVRLNYRNLFNQRHYLEIGFDFDDQGDYRSSRVVNHSDVVAPGELTLASLMDLAH
jgi:multidrug efflux pump subunit AcrA (membrane-fusion protein)